MKLLLRLLLFWACTLLAGCIEKCYEYNYIYLSGSEDLVVLESKKNPFKQTYTTAAIPIKFKLSRNEFYIIFALTEGNLPVMWAQVHAKNKGTKLTLVGENVVKVSEASLAGKMIDEVKRAMETPGVHITLADPLYVLQTNRRQIKGIKGTYSFQVVDENDTVLSKEQIRYEIRSNGKRCEYDSL